jgi:F-type H+/Na+-transporting ATPase subunit beta
MATGSSERSDNLELFLAVRRGDIEAAAQVLDRRPELVNAEEDWTEEEAHEARTLYANEATALVRASERDDLAMVRFLIERGADVNQVCGCAEAESPLWLAVTTRSTDMARYLVELGADVNCPAFAGHFPLHVAAMRGWDDLTELLLGAGADTAARDQGGRTPLDWALRNGHGSTARLLGAAGGPAPALTSPARLTAPVAERRSDLLRTGIKALDFFAPIRHGDLVRWDPGRICFHIPMLAELTHVLLGSGYASAVWAGFEDDFVNRRELMHGLMELGGREMAALMMGDREASPEERREHLAAVERHLEELRERGRVLVVVYQDAVQLSDPDTAFPALNRTGDHAITAICATPVRFPDRPLETIELRPPLRVRVAHEMKVAGREFPAVNGWLTVSANLTPDDVGAEHVRLAGAARAVLERYARLDPGLDFRNPGKLPEADRETATRAQRLHAFMTQPFFVAEPFTGMPGVSVPMEQTLRGVRRILEGELDEVPVDELFFQGALD